MFSDWETRKKQQDLRNLEPFPVSLNPSQAAKKRKSHPGGRLKGTIYASIF